MAKFKIGDKIKPPESSFYMTVVKTDELTHPMPSYLLKDDFGTFWDYCFGWEKQVSSDNVLRYGEYLIDLQPMLVDGSYFRICIIKYEGNMYYLTMRDGEIMEFKELM